MEQIQDIKKTIMQVTQGLKKDGITVTQNQILNIVAAANGFKNWSAYTNSDNTDKKQSSEIFSIEYKKENTYSILYDLIKDNSIKEQELKYSLNSENTLYQTRELIDDIRFKKDLLIKYNLIYNNDLNYTTHKDMGIDDNTIIRTNTTIDTMKKLSSTKNLYIDISNIKIVPSISNKNFAILILNILNLLGKDNSYKKYSIKIDNIVYNINTLKEYVNSFKEDTFIHIPSDITAINRCEHLRTLEKEYTTIIDNGQQILVYKCGNNYHLHTAQHTTNNQIYISKKIDSLILFALSSNILDCVGDIERYYFYTNPMVQHILKTNNIIFKRVKQNLKSIQLKENSSILEEPMELLEGRYIALKKLISDPDYSYIDKYSYIKQKDNKWDIYFSYELTKKLINNEKYIDGIMWHEEWLEEIIKPI